MGRYLGIVVAVTFLGGCGGAAMPAAMQAMPEHVRLQGHATSGDLLYVIDSFRSTVDIYAYPENTLVGSLTGFTRPSGLCVDRSGNVFVTDLKANDIVEYAHGGTSPIAMLTESETSPSGCAVDPTTGNLAVANAYVWTNKHIQGNVAIFKHARGKPKIYTDYPAISYYNSCTYDANGNLYVEGDFPSGSALAELPKGAESLTTIPLQNYSFTWGGVQWDGRYVALQRYDRDHNAIYRLSISGSKATIVAKVATKGPRYIGGFWIQGNTVIVPNGPRRVNEVGTWPYPAGGRAQSEFKVPGSWFVAAVISPG